MSGLGLALRSTWDVGAEIKSGILNIVLPEYRGSRSMSIYAVYPSREFVPAKVKVFIEFLSHSYGARPQWEKGLEAPAMPVSAKRRARPTRITV